LSIGRKSGLALGTWRRADDVAPNGYAVDRANIRQRKTGWPVRFELAEVMHQALDEYLRMTGRTPGE